jgi:hypothetical protein
MNAQLEQNSSKKKDASSYVIGGLTLIGIGTGFLFFKVSVFIFLGCMFAGLCLGLVVASLMKCSGR